TIVVLRVPSGADHVAIRDNQRAGARASGARGPGGEIDLIATGPPSDNGHTEAKPAARPAYPRAISPCVAAPWRRPLPRQYQSHSQTPQTGPLRTRRRGRRARIGPPVPEDILAIRSDGACRRSYGERRVEPDAYPLPDQGATNCLFRQLAAYPPLTPL